MKKEGKQYAPLPMISQIMKSGGSMPGLQDAPVNAPVNAPVTEVQQGFLVVTFKAQMVSVQGQPESRPESRPESDIASRILTVLQDTPKSRNEIAASLGHRSISGAMKKAVANLLEEDLIAYTIPEKTNSRLQKYRLTLRGSDLLGKTKSGDADN